MKKLCRRQMINKLFSKKHGGIHRDVGTMRTIYKDGVTTIIDRRTGKVLKVVKK